MPAYFYADGDDPQKVKLKKKKKKESETEYIGKKGIIKDKSVSNRN